MMTDNGTVRADLLAAYGRYYGEQHFAVAFTAGTQGDDAKRVTNRGWDKTAPLADGDYGASYVAGRGALKNPVIVLRPSNLIVLECDSEDDLVRIEDLQLPPTVTVRSSEPYKRHYYYRPAPELDSLPYVAFRFETGKLTADSGRYFLAPPSIHPSGAIYGFMPDHGPEDLPIATLPASRYHELAQNAQVEDDQLREAIELDPNAKIQAGNRRAYLFRYACMLRRWGLTRDEILEQTLRYNNSRCVPPVERRLVEVQVDGAMKKRGGQELARTPDEYIQDEPAPQTEAFQLFVRTAVEIEATPDPPATDSLLGPLITKGERTIVVGDTGHGKTTLALQLLRAILTGDEALGHTGTKTGPVMVIDLEQGRRAIKRGLREAHLHNRPDVLHISVPDGLALDKDPQHVAELNRVIAQHKPVVLLLDPYYKAHRADDPNQERPIIDLMRQLDALRTEHGFALLLPAHPRKEIAGKEGARKLTLNDIAGSGAVTRGAEIILGLERLAHGYARLRYLKDREGELPVGDAIALLYDKEQGFRLDPRDDESDEAIEARILEQNTGWQTAPEWQRDLGIRKAKAVAILGQMAAAGRIAYMLGPPGRSKSARCYGTSPECWEQSGTPGTPSQIPIESETVPGGPPPVRGNHEREQSNDHSHWSGTTSTENEEPDEQDLAFLDTLRATELEYPDDIPF